MADHIDFKIKVTPVEEIGDEQSNKIRVISGEVGVSLGGSGESVDLTNYSGSASVQGYKDGAVNYLDATHSAGGTALLESARDFIFIKNTGHKFSTATVLGNRTTDCVMVVIKEEAHSSVAQAGYIDSSNSEIIHFYEVAWLQPGDAIVLPCGATQVVITTNIFGSTDDDLSPIGISDTKGNAKIYVRTFLSNGGAASDGNAVEYLSVT